ncbi:unnamed protein product [Strongylus vulgaris]|uniref:Ig-like domain-containing protein n=1 Tax=Strongylus vulgaris TaxID=40348 RepID=A0A3P7JGA9_STRVU|nr:unnamed protein product [Strongylus vulgaris]
MKAHRFVLSQDFGYIALNILYCYPEDSGTYTLVVRNAAGEAQSTVDIDCRIDGVNYRDSLHPSSLQRIKELETPQQRAEPPPEKPKEQPQILKGLPPKFDVVHESQTLHLEAQVAPVDDNTLKYEWLYNGQPLKASSRYRILNDFGFVTLDIDYVIAEDAGKYTLVISNAAGKAETSCEFDVERLKSILSDTAHPESLRRITEMEQLQPAKPSEEEMPLEPPVFTQQLTGPSEVLKEGQSVHMDCVVQPINDPNLKIEWFCDERPLMFGSRIRTIHDFGYVGLEFLHVHPEDTGTYICRATNAAGTAETRFKLECRPRRNLYLDTQHETSWAKIQEMENREEIREPSPEISYFFAKHLASLNYLELPIQLSLIYFQIEWFCDERPLMFGSRIRTIHDFGYVGLEFLHVHPEDTGTYICRATNAAGTAETRFKLECRPRRNLYLDTQHETSWAKIQEMENREEIREPSPEMSFPPPQFTEQLKNVDDATESDAVRLDCRLVPVNDPTMKVSDLMRDFQISKVTSSIGTCSRCTGQLMETHYQKRVVLCQPGISTMSVWISWDCTQKTLGYTLARLLELEQTSKHLQIFILAVSQFGEAATSCTVKCAPIKSLQLDTQHEASWNRVQEIENKKPVERVYEEPEKAVSQFGEAATSCTVKCAPIKSLQLDTQHEASWNRVQEIENKKPVERVYEEPEKMPPHFVVQLPGALGECPEGTPIHFECQVEPTNDNQLAVQWYGSSIVSDDSHTVTYRTQVP